MPRSPSLKRRTMETEIIVRAARLNRLIETRAEKRYARVGIQGMTAPRAMVLSVLFHAKDSITAQQLSAELGVSKVTASRLVGVLERDGWVSRKAHPVDGRAYVLSLTTKARRALPKFVETHNETLDLLLGGHSNTRLIEMRDDLEYRIGRIEADIERGDR